MKTNQFLALSTLLLSFTALAQTAPRTLSLDDVMRIAFERNGHIQAAAELVEAQRSQRHMAYELPKLNVQVQLGQYSSPEHDQLFAVEQTIPFPTVFGAKRRLASAEVEASRLGQSLAVMELRKQLRTLYYRAQYLEQLQQLRGRLDSLYSDFDAIASLRYRAGDAARVDATAARAKRGEVRLATLETQAELASLYAELASVMNVDEPFVLANGKPLIDLSLGNVLDSSHIERHPSVEALVAEARIAQRSRSLVLHEALPDLTLGYTNQSLIGTYSIGGQDVYWGRSKRFHFFTLGVSIPLNVSATVASARRWGHQRRAAEARANQQRRSLEAEMQTALVNYEHSLRQYRYYTQEALPSAEDIIQAAQAGYRAGEISYVEYLYAIETATSIQTAYLESILKVNQTAITILSLINQ